MDAGHDKPAVGLSGYDTGQRPRDPSMAGSSPYSREYVKNMASSAVRRCLAAQGISPDFVPIVPVVSSRSRSPGGTFGRSDATTVASERVVPSMTIHPNSAFEHLIPRTLVNPRAPESAFDHFRHREGIVVVRHARRPHRPEP